MEQYPGAVILATNFRRNIDDAFVRRLDFVIDFPFIVLAGAGLSYQTSGPVDVRTFAIGVDELLWRGPPADLGARLPRGGPVAADVDLDFLGNQFKLSGGAIRNCSLAAFRAADEASGIEMRHLVRAVAQEYGRQCRLTLESDFERFHTSVRGEAR